MDDSNMDQWIVSLGLNTGTSFVSTNSNSSLVTSASNSAIVTAKYIPESSAVTTRGE